MEKLKVDKTRLITVSNYAKDVGVTRATVYNWAKEGRVRIEEIDGIMFVERD